MTRTRKFLSCALVAMLLLALFPLSAQAATYTAPSDGSANGLTAKVTFDKASPQDEDTAVKATVTVTGTPTATGNMKIDLTSVKAGLTTSPKTLAVTQGTAVNASNTFDFTFDVPAVAVDDFALTFAVVPKLAYTAPSDGSANGLTAKVTFDKASPQDEDTAVKATVTVTGTPTATGNMKIDLTSVKAGLTTSPKTLAVTQGTAVNASNTFDFTFDVPAVAVDDFALTFAVVPKSTDATLKTIAVKGTTVTVTGTNVTVTVPYSKQGGETLTALVASGVTAATTDAGATAVVTKVSDGKFTITVTPEDSTAPKKTYNLTVVYAAESTDATLKSIVVLGQTARISGTTATVSLPYAIWHTDKGYTDVNDLVAGTDITATPNYVTATAATAGSGASWLITVTAEDGSTKKDYTLTVTFAAAPSSGGGSYGSNGSWPGDNYPPAPPPPAEVLPGTPGTGSSSPTAPSATNPFSFRVLARSLNVRSGPGTSYAKVGTLRANDVVSIVGYSADGLWAQTQAGSWVSLAYVSQVVTVDVGDYIVTVTSGSLNVRSGPGTSSAKIGSLANNALVMVHSVTNGWAQIEYNGGVGYVSVLYLR